MRIKSRVYWKMKRMEEFREIGKDTIEEYKNNNKTEEELEECKRFRLEALLKEVKIEANSNGERIPIYEEGGGRGVFVDCRFRPKNHCRM